MTPLHYSITRREDIRHVQRIFRRRAWWWRVVDAVTRPPTRWELVLWIVAVDLALAICELAVIRGIANGSVW